MRGLLAVQGLYMMGSAGSAGGKVCIRLTSKPQPNSLAFKVTHDTLSIQKADQRRTIRSPITLIRRADHGQILVVSTLPHPHP